MTTKNRAKPFSPNAIVRKLVTSNPKRPGSASYSRFAQYRSGMTVAGARKAGVRREDLHWDVRHGFVQVVRRYRKAA